MLKWKEMFRFSVITAIFLSFLRTGAQPMYGSTGLMNIPSAEMQKDGTVMIGANYLPDEMTPAPFEYNTGNYYLNITFLPFFEFSYRMTLMKMSTGNYNQDRSFGMRLQLLREHKNVPALLIGGHDIYSSSGQQLTYFNALYAVATKNFRWGKSSLGVTAGYARKGFGGKATGSLRGIFSGAVFTPGFYPGLHLIGEYDTHAVNTGVSALFFRHFSLFGMLHNLKTPAGGFAVLFYL